jgi:hypothetical protein
MGVEAAALVKLLFQTGVVDKEWLAKRRRAAPMAVVRRLIVPNETSVGQRNLRRC